MSKTCFITIKCGTWILGSEFIMSTNEAS